MLYGNEVETDSVFAVVKWFYPAQLSFAIFPVMESALTPTIFSDTVHNRSLQYVPEGRALCEVIESWNLVPAPPM